jgi:hypothetical protein
MKREITATILWAMLLLAQTTFAKEIKEVDKAFENFEQNKLTILKDDTVIGVRIAQLLKKLESKDPEDSDPVGNTSEELLLLASMRAHPSKIHLKHLTALWNYHQPLTHKALYPEAWKSVKSIDYDQKLSDKISDLYEKCGGNPKDLNNLNNK